ncbi:MAG: hypothetical protein KDK39_07945 [Leptospiraceae bacterium]|nr:hypothetical protein [Leptospiraceae bacterium]
MKRSPMDWPAFEDLARIQQRIEFGTVIEVPPISARQLFDQLGQSHSQYSILWTYGPQAGTVAGFSVMSVQPRALLRGNQGRYLFTPLESSRRDRVCEYYQNPIQIARGILGAEPGTATREPVLFRGGAFGYLHRTSMSALPGKRNTGLELPAPDEVLLVFSDEVVILHPGGNWIELVLQLHLPDFMDPRAAWLYGRERLAWLANRLQGDRPAGTPSRDQADVWLARNGNIAEHPGPDPDQHEPGMGSPTKRIARAPGETLELAHLTAWGTNATYCLLRLGAWQMAATSAVSRDRLRTADLLQGCNPVIAEDRGLPGDSNHQAGIALLAYDGGDCCLGPPIDCIANQDYLSVLCDSAILN